MRQVLRAVAAVAAWGVLVCVIAGYGGELFYPLDALAHFRLHLALVVPPIAAVALGVRHWAALWRAGVAGLLAVAGLGIVFETSPTATTPTPPTARTITVMTANLFQGNPKPELMRAALLAESPDILITHETGRTAIEGLTSLEAHYPYKLALITTRSALRTVIWSKLPMRDGRLFLEDTVEPTGVRATISIADGVEFGILGLHLAHTISGRQHVQIEALDRIAETMPTTRIILGDLNLTPWSWGMRRIEALTGTHRLPGYRVTWHGAYETPLGPVPSMLGQPIDHVLVSPDVTVDGVRTVQIPGSDHLAVFARMTFPTQ